MYKQRAAHILQSESPDWEIVLTDYQRMKGDHRLTDIDIARFLGYKSANSFRNSARYRQVVTGLVRLWIVTQ